VYLPNCTITQVSHIGSCALSAKSVITNALHVLDLKYNLLSVSQITKELCCSVTFFSNFCVFHELYTGKVKEVGKEEGGLYLLLSQLTHGPESEVKKSVCVVPRVLSSIEVWHQRLGHVSSIVLARLFDMNKDSMCKVSKCTVCPCAKQTRLPFHSSSIKSNACFDLIHVDVWGPYNTPTFDGNKYFLTIVDDFSRMT